MRLKTEFLFSVIAALIILLPACSRQLEPEEGCNFVQNAQSQRLSWGNQLPVKLYVHSSVPVAAHEAIDRAVAEYNARLGDEVFRVVARGTPGEVAPARDGYSTIYWFSTWEADKATEQARTTIYWSGIEIFEADIRIKGAGISYYYGADANFTGVDLTSLLVHELGHVLGLSHNVTSGSVMNFELQDGLERRTVGQSDLASLKCEY